MSSPSLPPQAERSFYDGMRGREGEVFRRWLRLHESEYERFDYNVRVGPGRDPGSLYSESVRKSAIASSQKRIDAVAWQGAQPTIIEVKDFATLQAIGQALEYAAVWRQFRTDTPAPRVLVVCVRAELGFAERAAAAGVDVSYVSGE